MGVTMMLPTIFKRTLMWMLNEHYLAPSVKAVETLAAILFITR
jgi:hypothetical protein